MLSKTENLLKGFEKWLLGCEKSPFTVRSYLEKVVPFCQWLDARAVDILEVDPQEAGYFFQYLLLKKKHAANTRNLAYTAIRQFYNYLVAQQLMAANPLDDVTAPKKEYRKMGALTNDEVQLLIHAPGMDTERGLRDTAMIALLTAVGSRVSALTRLRLGDIRAEEVTLPPRCGYCNQVDYSGASRMRPKKKTMAILTLREKGNKQWDIPLNDKGAFYLNQYLVQREFGSDSDIVFPALKRRPVRPISRAGILSVIKRYAREAKIKGSVSPHSFRRAAITWLLDCGVDEMVVKNYFGHAALSTTERYRNVTHRSFMFAGVAAEKNLLEAIETPMDKIIEKG